MHENRERTITGVIRNDFAVHVVAVVVSNDNGLCSRIGKTKTNRKIERSGIDNGE